MSRHKKRLKKAAAEAETAGDKGAAALDHAAAAVTQAAGALAAYVSSASEKVAPAAKSALANTKDFAEKARDKAEPALDKVSDRLAPGVDAARQKVQDDLIPKLNDLLHEAEKHPAVKEATKRGSATLAAVKGQLDLPDRTPIKKKKNVGRTLAKVLAAGALLAGAAVAVRQFLLNKDDDWTAHEPSPAYTGQKKDDAAPTRVAYSTQTATDAAQDEPTEDIPAAQDEAPVVDAAQEAPVVDPVAGDTHPSDTAASTDLPHTRVTDTAPSEDFAADDAEGHGPSVPGAIYGEGAYVGTEPPAEFAIKGNERSKKYHVPDSAGYERTIADVWFSTEEAAQSAGFSKAQR